MINVLIKISLNALRWLEEIRFRINIDKSK